MSTLEILSALQNSALAHAVSKTDHLVGAALQVVHILGFVVLLAALVLISLRLLGLAFAAQPVPAVAQGIHRLIWWGLLATFLSGALMFIASPLLYAQKSIFLVKLGLIVLATLAQFFIFRKAIGHDPASPASGRAAAVLSLALWFGVAAAGRTIGFV